MGIISEKKLLIHTNNKLLEANLTFKGFKSTEKNQLQHQSEKITAKKIPALNAMAAQNISLLFTGKKKGLPETMQRVLSKVQVAEVAKHHDTALNTIKTARQKGVCSEDKPLTLLHFDLHSDLNKYDIKSIDYGNWINHAIKEGSVNEVYWVLPEWTKEKYHIPTFWEDQNDDGNGEFYLIEGKTEYTFYVNKKSNGLHFNKPEDYNKSPDKYRVVNLHKITIDELPDMKGKNNLMLDICGDYVSSNGHSVDIDKSKIVPVESFDMVDGRPDYSSYNAQYPKQRKIANIKEIHKRFKHMFNVLETKNIRPIVYTAAYSPEYVPKDYGKLVAILLDHIQNKAC